MGPSDALQCGAVRYGVMLRGGGEDARVWAAGVGRARASSPPPHRWYTNRKQFGYDFKTIQYITIFNNKNITSLIHDIMQSFTPKTIC
ncbi:hypothetical protein RR48_15435 [Papilio machaon]|uniref:Uncharacterized protein n=1 Tax=Papilio machaon TaxID=76193 RepID=A0A194QVE6_PAPMA|nr:hypothetical protein RR48_15435 [Papilio machaon]